MPTLTTRLPGCLLRPWADGDQDALVRLADDRRVWRNMTDSFPHPYTRADADGWVVLANAPGRSLHLAITVDGALAGGVGAIAGEAETRATAAFGYWLGQPFWGRGLATAAATALGDHLLGQGLFARLEARVYAWNPPSARVLEKSGFTREATLRHSITKDGQLIDSWLYARTRD
jgi:[ribosomal protein S5]-alanine N-acetyltransferase